MKTTVTREDFLKAFKDMDRESNFSHKGLNALYDHFEAFEEDTGESVDLDVIAICCDYTETTIEDALESYNLSSMDALEDSTTVVYKDDENVLFQNF